MNSCIVFNPGEEMIEAAIKTFVNECIDENPQLNEVYSWKGKVHKIDEIYSWKSKIDKIDTIESNVRTLKSDVKILKSNVKGLKSDFRGMRLIQEEMMTKLDLAIEHLIDVSERVARTDKDRIAVEKLKQKTEVTGVVLNNHVKNKRIHLPETTKQ